MSSAARRVAVPAGVVALLACEAWLAGAGGAASGVQPPAWVLSIAVVSAAAILGAVMAVLATAIGLSRPRRREGGGSGRPTRDAPWVVRALAVLVPIGFIALALGIADLERHAQPPKPQPGNGPIESGRPIAKERRPAADAPVGAPASSRSPPSCSWVRPPADSARPRPAPARPDCR